MDLSMASRANINRGTWIGFFPLDGLPRNEMMYRQALYLPLT